MQIVLDVPKQMDLNWLLKLFQQLNLRVVQKIEANPASGAAVPERLPEPEPSVDPELWRSVVKPIRQNQSIEDMISEQNYKGMDLARMDELIERLDIQEPVETLLAQLTP